MGVYDDCPFYEPGCQKINTPMVELAHNCSDRDKFILEGVWAEINRENDRVFMNGDLYYAIRDVLCKVSTLTPYPLIIL